MSSSAGGRATSEIATSRCHPASDVPQAAVQIERDALAAVPPRAAVIVSVRDEKRNVAEFKMRALSQSLSGPASTDRGRHGCATYVFRTEPARWLVIACVCDEERTPPNHRVGVEKRTPPNSRCELRWRWVRTGVEMNEHARTRQTRANSIEMVGSN